jgi:predicted lipoprotein with Yx(FWY)xxD motif
MTTDNQQEEQMRTHTSRGSRAIRAGAALSAAAAGLLVLASCGSGAGGTPAASDQSSSATTVTVRDAGGMNVLATSSGQTLYTSDQEDGKVLCTSPACEAVWTPLTVSAGQQPSSSGGVASHLSTLKRQDGSTQVAFDDRPLYTFSFDHSAGQVNGNGQSDSFDGTDFTWHAATPMGTASTSDSSQDSPYNY